MPKDYEVWYYEYYPHYMMGTIIKRIGFMFSDLERLYELFRSNAPDSAYDEIDRLVEAQFIRLPDYPKQEAGEYALRCAIVGDNDDPKKSEKHFRALVAKLKKGKCWGACWEEGSHALSPISLEDAKKKVKKIETKQFGKDF
jgi:hypothetical protein